MVSRCDAGKRGWQQCTSRLSREHSCAWHTLHSSALRLLLGALRCAGLTCCSLLLAWSFFCLLPLHLFWFRFAVSLFACLCLRLASCLVSVCYFRHPLCVLFLTVLVVRFFLIVRSPLCFFVSFHVLRSNGCFCVLYVVYMFAACLLFSFCSYSVFAWLLCSACFSLPALFVMCFSWVCSFCFALLAVSFARCSCGSVIFFYCFWLPVTLLLGLPSHFFGAPFPVLFFVCSSIRVDGLCVH